MYLIEQELRNQFAAATQTVDALFAHKDALAQALADVKSICVLGCGSSYSLAKSAATLLSQQAGIPATPIAAGDLLVNFPAYKRTLEHSAILLLSRSGATSEVVRAAALCKQQFGSRILSICTQAGAPVEAHTDLDLILPWAYDKAVCQTRTVSNLYIALLGLAYIAGGNDAGLQALKGLEAYSEPFCSQQEAALKELAQQPWTRAVVLADSGPAGLAEEGALAFKEICRRDSNHYHMLDVRHGPMVQINQDVLVIALVSSGDRTLQAGLLADIAKKTSRLLVLDCAPGPQTLPGHNIQLPACGSDEAKAVFALYCIQVLCLHHAQHRGVDPDNPDGLDAWIKL